MSLRHELITVIRAFVDGKASLAGLHHWLIDHVQEVADSHDLELDWLDAQAWMLISERDLGHRTEESVREELRAALQPPVIWTEGKPAAVDSSDAVLITVKGATSWVMGPIGPSSMSWSTPLEGAPV